MLHNVAVLFHPHRQRAIEEARWLQGALGEAGAQAVLGSGWDAETVRRDACGKDLVVALGGDGTIIQITRQVAPCGAPVLGVNLGRVGFLAELTPEDLRKCLPAVIEGDFWVEERSMLDVKLDGNGGEETFLALNELAVARGLSPRAIHVQTALDSVPFLTYTADAVLVATATGSTAYSLAAGGAIMFPQDRNFMLTPVAPHLNIGRSIILPSDTEVRLTLASERAAVMSVDGSDERPLEPDHTVTVRRSQTFARFARLGPVSYFYQAISDRLR
ncbi:MAG: NAD(+)/NADH kinase [Chloroflexota bacterium]